MQPLKVGMISLGCNKNRVDSETALGLLTDKGYTITADPAEADILMVNTCGFIGPAKEESIDAILEMLINILSGQWALLPLKIGYLTNTTYGYIKWTKYIKAHKTETASVDLSDLNDLAEL